MTMSDQDVAFFAESAKSFKVFENLIIYCVLGVLL